MTVWANGRWPASCPGNYAGAKNIAALLLNPQAVGLRFLQLIGNVQAAYLRIGAVRAGRMARTPRFSLAVVRAVCTCLGAVIFLLPTIGVATAESKRILLLYSFGREFKPWSEYARKSAPELYSQSPWALDITEQSLITARSSDETLNCVRPIPRCPLRQTSARPNCEHWRACGRLHSAASA